MKRNRVRSEGRDYGTVFGTRIGIKGTGTVFMVRIGGINNQD